MIIDFHTHIFPDQIAASALKKLSSDAGIPPHTDGTAKGLSASMEQSGISLSINLPVLTHPGQSKKVNEYLLREREAMAQNGIVSFGGIHPEYEDVFSLLKWLKDEGFPGIKLHPAYQKRDLDDMLFLRIIDRASELGLIILTHAGLDIGIPEHNYASLRAILHVIDTLRPPRFVLAHMGGWADWDNVSKYLAGAPVWLDCAFSLRAGKDAPSCHMEPDAFVRLCRAHGTGRVLFATDCPWSDQAAYVQAFDQLPFTEKEREVILFQNAQTLLGSVIP